MRQIYVIVVTCNGIKWIEECLKSVLSSSIPVSLIVVDNSSSDTTIDFIKTSFPDVILLEQKENLGFGKANNIGIAYALKQNPDFVFLLNQDAKIEKVTIETLIRISESNADLGILTPLHLNWLGNGLEFGFYNEKLFSDLLLNQELKEFYLEDKFINASAWLLPVNTLNIVGGFDPIFFHYGEDVNYCQRVLFHGLKLVIVPKVKIFHDTTNNGVFEKNDKSQQLMIDERCFMNQTIIKFGDVNRLDYKLYEKFKTKFIFRTLYSLLLFDLTKAGEDFRKYKILTRLKIKESYLKNSKEGRHHF